METVKQQSKPINWTAVIIAAIITFGLLYWFLHKDAPKEGTVTTVKETVDIEHLVTEAVNNAIANQKPTQQYFTFRTDPNTGKQTVVNVQPGTEGAIKANVYKDTTKVNGGVIYSEIAAEGRVLQNKVRAEIEQKTITKTITNETVVHKSGLFLTGGAYLGDSSNLAKVQGGLQYTYKNDIGIGANLIYDTKSRQNYFGITVSKKIF